MVGLALTRHLQRSVRAGRFLAPGLSLVAFVLLWGVGAVVDGAMLLTTGIAARRSGGDYWSLILAGTSGLVAGITACVWPGITAAVLPTIVSLWAIARGALEIVAAVRLRNLVPRGWVMALSGAGSLLLGGLLLRAPVIALVTFVYLVGAGAMIVGILATTLALQLRRLSLHETAGFAAHRTIH